MKVGQECVVDEDDEENIRHLHIRNDAIGDDGCEDACEGPFEVLISQLVVFELLHYSVLNQFGPKRQIVNEGNDGEADVEDEKNIS